MRFTQIYKSWNLIILIVFSHHIHKVMNVGLVAQFSECGENQMNRFYSLSDHLTAQYVHSVNALSTSFSVARFHSYLYGQ